jgi:uncharacterized protein YodC (DUF2158 family)
MVKTKFNVGDVVQLNSGGPKMTVVDVQQLTVASPASYKTAWFDEGRAVAVAYNFPEDALKKGRG